MPEPPGHTARCPSEPWTPRSASSPPAITSFSSSSSEGSTSRPRPANQPGEVRGAANAFLILRFQPQHIHEQAFFQPGAGLPPASPKDASDTTADPPLPPGIVQSRLSGPSRLASRSHPQRSSRTRSKGSWPPSSGCPSLSPVSAYNPELTGCLPLDLLRRRSVHRSPHVAHQPTPYRHRSPVPPDPAPDDFAVWSHASKPVTHADWTELWHTRLASRRNATADPRDLSRTSSRRACKPTTCRAARRRPIPSCLARCARSKRDRPPDLEPLHRRLHPSPVETEQFTLTSLGATVKFEGAWTPPRPPRHRFPPRSRSNSGGTRPPSGVTSSSRSCTGASWFRSVIGPRW